MARSQNSQRARRNLLGGVRNKLLLFSIAGILPTIGVALAGYYTVGRLNQRTTAILVATSALRNHWEGDMMHDALRGDVLAALVAETEQDRSRERADIIADAKRLRDAMARNRVTALDPEIRNALDNLCPSLEAYIQEAETTEKLAESDRPRALQLLPHFENSFEMLGRRQALVSDVMMNRQARAEQASSRMAGTSQLLLLCITLVSLPVSVRLPGCSRAAFRGLSERACKRFWPSRTSWRCSSVTAREPSGKRTTPILIC